MIFNNLCHFICIKCKYFNISSKDSAREGLRNIILKLKNDKQSTTTTQKDCEQIKVLWDWQKYMRVCDHIASHEIAENKLFKRLWF